MARHFAAWPPRISRNLCVFGWGGLFTPQSGWYSGGYSGSYFGSRQRDNRSLSRSYCRATLYSANSSPAKKVTINNTQQTQVTPAATHNGAPPKARRTHPSAIGTTKSNNRTTIINTLPLSVQAFHHNQDSIPLCPCQPCQIVALRHQLRWI